MNAIIESLGKTGIIPVIKIDDAANAVPLAKALEAGGIPCAEVTFRTAAGEEAIRRIHAEVPGVLLGAGTVLTTEQADRAIGAGAQFIVSPGFNPKVVSHCIQKGIPVVPGCSNPSDIEQALELGLDVVKFFPAEQAGGLDYIKAISAPYPNLKFMPTGGINQTNLGKYIAFDKIVACGGSWMAGADLINAGEFDKIRALCREAILTLLGFSMVHVGINTPNEEAALKAATFFSALFGFTNRDGTASLFSSDGIEIIKSKGLGANGHIAIGTLSLPRAIAYFERQGVAFNRDSIKTDAKGNMTVIYFQEEIAGFAVHLAQKK
jgi:2-dehydro-3-deoxyphosphogluconate aldolase/(4S)-4-hydroxy-2-oxoglutarate aldolase